MSLRRPFAYLFGLALSAVLATSAMATPPAMLTAVSRITHGAAGNYDIQLPLTGGSGIECRDVAGGITLVMTFDQPVTAAQATVTTGTATLAAPTFASNVVSVKVTGIADASAFAVTLSNVTNAAGEVLTSTVVPFRTLFADINGDSMLSAADSNLTRSAVGSGSINGANFRCDVSIDGIFSAADTNRVRAAIGLGTSVAGGPTNNTIPTLSTITTQTAVTGTAMSPVGFTVGDTESDPSTLVVTSVSSDQVTIPKESIVISGSGASRALSVTPAAGVTSIVPVSITLYVSDGLAYSNPMTFTVNVTPPPTSFLATLRPVAGTSALSSGTAILTISFDDTYAILTYNVTNLSSAETDATVNDDKRAILYDIPVGRARGDVQPDGSFRWTFATGKGPGIRTAMGTNASYFHVETANHPAGELEGFFKPLSGSQTFSVPSAPPTFTLNPPDAVDASRFLQQAGFGGTYAQVAAMSNPSAPNASTAINDWLTAQFATPIPIFPDWTNCKTAPGPLPSTQPSSLPTTPTPLPTSLPPQSATQPYTTSSLYWTAFWRICTPQVAATGTGEQYGYDRINEAWWKVAINTPDPLRHRVATALSEIFVVSSVDGNVSNTQMAVASYYDMLADNAFGNFRTLLEQVTLNPVMGRYLTMENSKATAPNENYAREIMQLFTVGLYMLQPDGTLMLDAQGKPIPTYPQSTITSLAGVFTGWTSPSLRVTVPYLSPQTPGAVSNFVQYEMQPMSMKVADHSKAAKQLLVYPSASTTTIPAFTGTVTTTVMQSELKTALDNIFNHPNVGPFISKQLIMRLVTSNPSPAYVYRVAQKFNDNGQGVRGDMKAVITAILTDYEARTPQARGNSGYGKAREPIIRYAHLLHSLGATSRTGKWQMGNTNTTIAQSILYAPTVFNFFDPAYSQAGPIQQANLVSPELQIIFETTITNSQNVIFTGVMTNYNTDGTPKATGSGGFNNDIFLDYSSAGNGLLPLYQASGTSALVQRLVLLLSGGPLDDTGAAAARIVQAVDALPATTTPLARVQTAVYLVATSAQAAVQK